VNHYEILGIERTASPAEIKRAWRRKSKEHHPDRGGDPMTMALVNLAHDTLMDPRKREHYDLTGEEKPLTSDDIEARNGIIKLFMAHLVEGRTTNPVNSARRSLEAEVNQFTDQIKRGERASDRLRAYLPQVECSEPVSLWRDTIDAAVRQIESDLEKPRHTVTVLTRALEMLKAYRCEIVDPERAEANPYRPPPQAFPTLVEIIRKHHAAGMGRAEFP
jgi:curved DNA-binding protein CbpA